MDHGIANQCNSGTCSVSERVNLWEVHLVPDEQRNAMDSPIASDTTQPMGFLDMAKDMLDQAISGNKAPLGFHFHASWAMDTAANQQFRQFVQYALSLKNSNNEPIVWFVTSTDVIEYAKNPIKNSEMGNSIKCAPRPPKPNAFPWYPPRIDSRCGPRFNYAVCPDDAPYCDITNGGVCRTTAIKGAVNTLNMSLTGYPVDLFNLYQRLLPEIKTWPVCYVVSNYNTLTCEEVKSISRCNDQTHPYFTTLSQCCNGDTNCMNTVQKFNPFPTFYVAPSTKGTRSKVTSAATSIADIKLSSLVMVALLMILVF